MHICPGTLLHKGPIANACVAKGPKAEEEELLHNGDITHKTLFIQNGILFIPLNSEHFIGQRYIFIDVQKIVLAIT